MADEVDKVAGKELLLYIENDSDLYRQQFSPIIKNLVRKKKKGIYNSVGATKLFLYLVVNGAKKYYKENSPGGSMGWHKMFSPKTRLYVARELEKEFSENYENGEYT